MLNLLGIWSHNIGRSILQQACKPRFKFQHQLNNSSQLKRQYNTSRALNAAGKTFSNLTTKPHVFTLFGLGITFFLVAVNRVPGSGRWRVNFTSDSVQEKISERFAAYYLKPYEEKKLPTTSSEVNLIGKNLNRLVLHADTRYGQSWKVVVIDDCLVELFVVHNTIVISTGLLHMAESEDALAAALAHDCTCMLISREIAHNVARHVAESISLMTTFYIPFLLLGVPFCYYHKNISYSDFLYDMVIRLPVSRKMEYEADYLGLMITARSCYDPKGGVRFLKLLTASEAAFTQDECYHLKPWFASTHPLGVDRIRKLKERYLQYISGSTSNTETGRLPEALEQGKSSGCCQTIPSYSQLELNMGA